MQVWEKEIHSTSLFSALSSATECTEGCKQRKYCIRSCDNVGAVAVAVMCLNPKNFTLLTTKARGGNPYKPPQGGSEYSGWFSKMLKGWILTVGRMCVPYRSGTSGTIGPVGVSLVTGQIGRQGAHVHSQSTRARSFPVFHMPVMLKYQDPRYV